MIKQKAFTLSEIFIAMIILGVLVAVSIAAFSANRKDYSREYLYYTTYQTIVKVVDNALMNDDFLKDGLTTTDTCGYDDNKYKCRTFNRRTNIQEIFNEYTNNRGSVDNKLKLANGIELTFESNGDILPLDAINNPNITLADPEIYGFIVYADIDGEDKGENKIFYDEMVFFITLSGKVIPMYGTIGGYRYDSDDNAIRGHKSNGNTKGISKGQYGWYDGSGNNALIAFDVVYTNSDNRLLVLDNGHSVSFPEAACMSGYINAETDYCKHFLYNNLTGHARQSGVKIAPECNPDDNDHIAGGDCYPRLVQKMKWTK